MGWVLIILGLVLVLLATTVMLPIFPWGLVPSAIGGWMVGMGLAELL